MIFMTGCTGILNDVSDAINGTVTPAFDAGSDTELVTQNELDMYPSVPENVTEEFNGDLEGLYYYDHLSTEDRLIYTQMLYILQGMMEDVVISTMDEAQMDRVFNCVLYDHPELFYVEGYNYTRYLIGNTPQKMTFSGNYNMTLDEVNAHVERINAYIAGFSDALKNNVDNIDDYNIIKFVYEYIIKGTEYDMSAEYNQSIVSVIENGRSVCSGYSKTAQLLLNSCGIKTTTVQGFVKNGESHSWNLVLADGRYYYMDVTWGDASYTLRDKSDELANSLPPVNYNYLLITTNQIAETHQFNCPVELPYCESMEDNYFVREGLYFTAVDDQLLWQAFNRAYNKEQEYIMLKMDNADCYMQMRDHLLDDQKIFDFIISRDGSVSYAENRDQLYMIFWI